jgi:hypothetical protein
MTIAKINVSHISSRTEPSPIFTDDCINNVGSSVLVIPERTKILSSYSDCFLKSSC